MLQTASTPGSPGARDHLALLEDPSATTSGLRSIGLDGRRHAVPPTKRTSGAVTAGHTWSTGHRPPPLRNLVRPHQAKRQGFRGLSAGKQVLTENSVANASTRRPTTSRRATDRPTGPPPVPPPIWLDTVGRDAACPHQVDIWCHEQGTSTAVGRPRRASTRRRGPSTTPTPSPFTMPYSAGQEKVRVPPPGTSGTFSNGTSPASAMLSGRHGRRRRVRSQIPASPRIAVEAHLTPVVEDPFTPSGGRAETRARASRHQDPPSDTGPAAHHAMLHQSR